MWVKKKPFVIPSLEHYPPERAKRFTDAKITSLPRMRANWVKEKMGELGILDMRTAVEFGIRQVGYPLVNGVPDDWHEWNAYKGRDCYKVTEDYWDATWEVMMEVVLCRRQGCEPLADCDGSSEYITGMLRILGVDAWEVFGEVYRDSQPLGGHAYLYARFPDGKYKLIESTLDTPPKWPDGYPVIDPSTNKWRVGNITYVGDFRFNDEELYEWSETGSGGEEPGFRVRKHLEMTRRERERREKYDAIAEAYGVATKPHRKRGLLSRLRWR